MAFLKWGLVVLLIYMTVLLIFRSSFVFIDYFNLAIHEAGHLLLMLSGPNISILGGTFSQMLVPIICGAVLVYQQNDWFGGGICLWWLGENLVNVGRYMADAPYQQLPLIGGEHDWAYLFNQWQMMDKAEISSQFINILGVILMLVGIGWLIIQILLIPKPSGDENNFQVFQ
jgi:hypothetical protein